MAEKLSKILAKVLSSSAVMASDDQHYDGCGQQDLCRHLADEMSTIERLIVLSNHLNDYYCHKMSAFEGNVAADRRPAFRTRRRQLMAAIESETRTIQRKVRRFVALPTANTSAPEMRCDFCDKCLSPQRFGRHLATHLGKSWPNDTDRKPDSVLSVTHVCETRDESAGHVMLDSGHQDVKAEPIDESDAGDDCHLDDNAMSDDTEGSDEGLSSGWGSVRSGRRSSDKRSLSGGSENDLSQRGDVVCNECDKKFKNNKSLGIHMARKHNIRGKCQTISCYKCGQKVWKLRLRDHMKEEHNISGYSTDKKRAELSCTWPDCGLSFRSQAALDKHYGGHTGDLPFKCQWPGCDQQYDKPSRLDGHMTMHTGEKPYECDWPECGKSFRHLSTLRCHSFTHNRDTPRKHVCYYPGCEKSFICPSKLTEHVFSTHKKDEKPFKCHHEGCKSTFISKKNMRLHLRTVHASTRPRFWCSITGCKRSFYEQKALQKHEQKSHVKEPKAKKPRKKWVPPPGYKRFAYTTKNAQCDWPGCDYKAEYQGKVNVHKMRAHTGEKPVACGWPGCTYRAVRKCEIDIHMRKHTGEAPYPCELPNCGRRFKSQRALDTHWHKNHNM